MSMVPLLFRDWWDEDDFGRPSRLLDQHFGLGLRRDDLLNSLNTIPRRSRLSNYIRPWNTSSALTRQDSGSTITQDKDKFQKMVQNSKESSYTRIHKDYIGDTLDTEVKKNTEETYSNPQKMVQNSKETSYTRIHKDYLGNSLDTEVKKNIEGTYNNPQKMVQSSKETSYTRIHKDYLGDTLDTEVKKNTEGTYNNPQNMVHNSKETLNTKHKDYLADTLYTEVKKYTEETDNPQVILDVQQFAPNEITVKTNANSIIVEGKHEEKQDEHGFISRHFVRRYLLPETHDVGGVVSSLSSDGILTVSAPKKSEKPVSSERVVPITQTGPAKSTVQPTDPQPKIEHPTN